MKLLLCTDGSPDAAAATELIGRLPLPGDTEIVVLTVMEREEPFDRVEAIGDPDERKTLAALQEADQEAADELVARAAEPLLKTHLAVRTDTRAGPRAPTLLGAAEELGADLIVLGARGATDEGRAGLGRVCRRVLKHAPCSVLVVRHAPPGSEPPAAGEPLRLLLAYDGSESAQAAVAELAALPLGDRARVTVLTVLTVATTLYRRDILERMSETWQAYRSRAQEQLDGAVAALEASTPQVEARLLDGGTDAADEILEATRLLDCDLAVLGYSGRGALQSLLLGSVTTDVLEQAPCSVWVVRP